MRGLSKRREALQVLGATLVPFHCRNAFSSSFVTPCFASNVCELLVLALITAECSRHCSGPSAARQPA